MGRTIGFFRSSRPRLGRSTALCAPRPRALALESLEPRRLLAVDLAAVASQLNGRLSQIDGALGTIDSAANRLPVINQPMTQIQDARNVIAHFQQALTGAVDDPAATKAAFQQNLWNALGGPGLKMLVDASGGALTSAGQIDVPDFSANALTVHLNLARTFTVATPLDFGLGLDGIPFSADAGGNVDLGVTFSYKDLTFGWSNNAPFFSASAADEMHIVLTASLNGAALEGNIGFFRFAATDATPGVPEFQGDFSFDVTSAGGVQNVSLTGGADLTLTLQVQMDANFPSLATDLHVGWAFSGTNPKAAATSFGSPPTVELNSVSVSLGSMLTQMVKPIIEVIQPATKPLQPIIDVLNTPLPGLNELYHTITEPDVDLSTLEIVRVANSLGLIPEGYSELAAIADIALNLANLINSVEAEANNLIIDFGDYSLSELAAGKDLRTLNPLAGDPAQTLAEKAQDLSIGQLQPDFVNLVGSFDFGQVEDLIDGSSMSDSAKTALKSALNKLIQTSQNGLDYTFPLLDHPLQGMVGLLLGNDAPLFTFKAHFFADLQKSPLFDLPMTLPFGLDINLAAALTLDTHFEAGYDTRGLREFLADPSNPEMLLDGFYISADTRFKVDGTAKATAGVDTMFFDAGVDGGLSAGLHVVMDPAADVDGDNKVHIKSELGPCLFESDGALSLGISAFAKIGVDVPLVGFVGIEEHFDIVSTDLFSFSTGCQDNPFDKPSPIHLAGPGTLIDPNVVDAFNVDGNGTLTLNMGPNAGNRSVVDNQDVAESFVVSHVDPDPAHDPPGAKPGEIVTVSAFGFSEKYYGVTKIVAFGGAGNDSIVIKPGVTVDAELHGGVADDTLKHLGSGNVRIFGDAGDDILIGGGGTNRLTGGDGLNTFFLADNDTITGGTGRNFLFGERGNDVLVGGTGLNDINGGAGDDTLLAGPGSDLLDGSDGNDRLEAGAGNAKLLGNRGDDVISWKPGDGSPTVDGGSGTDSFGMAGTDAADTYTLGRSGAASYEAQIDFATAGVEPPESLLVRLVEKLVIQGGLSADTITVNEVTHSSVKDIGVNLGDLVALDNAKDLVVVNGTLVNDGIGVSTEAVAVYKNGHATGGVERVAGLPSYVVHFANVSDDGRIFGLAGNDFLGVTSIPGPTLLDGGANDDSIAVFASAASDYLAALEVDGSAGGNRLVVFDQPAAGDKIHWTDSHVTSGVLPLGVHYFATGGNFAQGVFLSSGPGPDEVFVRSTLPGIVTDMFTGGGDDTVTVSSDETLAGHLGDIQGELKIDTGGNQNTINVVDYAATAGNSAVVVTVDQIQGMAGPTDNTLLRFGANAGDLTLRVVGSNSKTLPEAFRVDSAAATLVLNGLAGSDTFNIVALAQPATINAGEGDDSIHVSDGANTLDSLQGELVVVGAGGADLLEINDRGTATGKAYALGSDTLSRAGASPILFAAVETVTVRSGEFNDPFTVVGIAPAVKIALIAGGGGDTLVAPNTANQWKILGPGDGQLGGNLSFSAFEFLNGGSSTDTFLMTQGVTFQGAVQGGAGIDTLDYSAYTVGVRVHLNLLAATGIFGAVSDFENVSGGAGADLLVGNAIANRLTGNGGNDILVGNGGDDQLFGGGGRDILIGGAGKDFLRGGNDDDILVDGTTTYDGNDQALLSLMAEWSRPSVSYTLRISHLRNGGGLNGAFRLKSTTVTHDASVDQIFGEGSRDWFWAKTANPDKDMTDALLTLEEVN